MDKFEASILDGPAFRGPRTPSPTRSSSTTSPFSSSPGSSSSSPPSPLASHLQQDQVPLRSTGPQTGPKGVLADSKYAARRQEEMRRESLRKTQQRLQKLALVGATSEEQERLERRERRLRERLAQSEKRGNSPLGESQGDSGEEEQEVLRRYRARRLAELKGEKAGEDIAMSATSGRLVGWQQQVTNQAHFGHLREIDERGYVKAVEGTGDGDLEAKAVVVHIYSKLVPASNQLTAALTSLARLYPSTKFLQIRALSINFGLPPSSTDENLDDDDEYDDEAEDPDLAESERRLRQLDKEESLSDVLPTLLIYKRGLLLGNLVRVDLEKGWNDGSERAMQSILRSFDAL